MNTLERALLAKKITWLVELLIQDSPRYCSDIARSTGLDRRAVDDAVYELVSSGRVRIRPDSILEAVSEPVGRVAVTDRRSAESRADTRRQEDRTRAVVATQNEERAKRLMRNCTVPPPGWMCTRTDVPHTGPCAAVPACGCRNGCKAWDCPNL